MMIWHYSKILLALVGALLVSVGQVLAQELVVEWGDQQGNPIPNALRNAIANDTLRPADRVYKLKRGGFYWNEDRIDYNGYHLRLVGETVDEAGPEAFVCGDGGDEDCGPAIIQRVAREDLSIDGVMLTNSGNDSDLTVRNVWLMGQDDQGGRSSYEQIALNASDSDFWFDNVIFDKNDWHFLGPNSTGCNMYVTNSVFRNLHGPSQQWEGLGVRFEAGADTVMFENNTFLNIGFTPFQSEAAPMNFFVANHNTFVNIGRSFQAGNIWKEAYVTNNVFLNPFWHGEMPSEYNDPDREDPYTGFFGIGALPARFGTDLDRRIVLANNSYWRDEAFETYGADSIRTQPIVNDTTMGYFNAWDGMVMSGNYVGEMADVASYSDLQAQFADLISNIVEIRGGSSDATLYPFDPGRDEECFVCNIWPLPEDFSYTNETLRTGGTDGLPLGDLNWFSDSKEIYLANREAELAKIVAMAGARVTLNIVSTFEGEVGVLEGDAEVAPAEGFTYYSMDGGGFIQWSFDVPAAGVHSLVVSTHLRGNSDRGQRIIINGNPTIRNNAGYGESFWSATLGDPTNEWFESTITQAG
ncbi:MAG TPA: hypothetical protein VJB15_02040, partial [Rhodothermia bacterium]|nr:hypothetical protein [Rhodothermia bacterium]